MKKLAKDSIMPNHKMANYIKRKTSPYEVKDKIGQIVFA